MDNLFDTMDLGEELAKSSPTFKKLKDDGWFYRELPWMDTVYWNEFFRVAGEGNYVAVTIFHRNVNGGVVAARGTFFFSPAVLDNIAEWQREHGRE